MSALAKQAPLVLMTLFHRILDKTMFTVRVVSSNGYSSKLPPTVMRTRLGDLFLGMMINNNAGIGDCPVFRDVANVGG